MRRVSYKAPIKSRPPSYSVKPIKNIARLSGRAPACIAASITAYINATMLNRMRSGLLIRDVQCHRVKRIFFDAGDFRSQCSRLADRAFL